MLSFEYHIGMFTVINHTTISQGWRYHRPSPEHIQCSHNITSVTLLANIAHGLEHIQYSHDITLLALSQA